jgi:hypothetical protein
VKSVIGVALYSLLPWIDIERRDFGLSPDAPFSERLGAVGSYLLQGLSYLLEFVGYIYNMQGTNTKIVVLSVEKR